jgi:hypothetical protein
MRKHFDEKIKINTKLQVKKFTIVIFYRIKNEDCAKMICILMINKKRIINTGSYIKIKKLI